MPLVLRNVKQAKLTWAELDGNFTYLEDKIDAVAAAAGGTEIVRVTPQTFLPAQQNQARANLLAAAAEDVADLQDRVEFLESVDPVLYSAQSPTPTQQQTARDNISALSTTPNGTDLLIGTNNKIADTYLPDSLFGQLKWGGTFNASGIISATADFPQLNGTNITALNTVQYKGVYFIASFADSAVINIHGVEYNNGDWAVANGNVNGFNKADNSDAVSSVAGRRGVVVLDMNDIQGLVAELADFVKKEGGTMDGTLIISQPDVSFGRMLVLENEVGGNWGFSAGINGVSDTRLNIGRNNSGVIQSDFVIDDIGNTGIGVNAPQAKLHVNGNAIVDDATANNHAVTLGQVNGLVTNGNTAYNERVTQFNTTYTTSVYTFSVVLANGVQKQTTFQVNNTHFTINGSGVLQLNAAIAQKINDSVTTNTTQTISATKDFTVSPTVPYASDSEHPVPFLQMQEYIANRLDAISSYSRSVIDYNDATIGVKEFIKTVVFTGNPTGTVINPDIQSLKNGATLNICTQAITAGSIYINMPIRRLDGLEEDVFSGAQGLSYIFYYDSVSGRWDETHAINNS